MGQLALIRLFLKNFVLVAIPEDVNENRRHVHVFQKNSGARRQHSVAKVWMESNGVKDVSIAESSLSTKENEELVREIDENWEFINNQISTVFSGVKPIVKTLN